MHSDIINMQRGRRNEQKQWTRNGLRLSKQKVDLDFATRHSYKDLSNHLMFCHWSKTRRPVTIMIVKFLGATFVLQLWNYICNCLPYYYLLVQEENQISIVWILFKVSFSSCTEETEDSHYFLVTIATFITC